MSPQRTNLVLATHIPYVEFNVLVGDRFDVEADGRNRGDILAQLEFVKNRYTKLAAILHLSWLLLLVLPAASSPNISSLISLDPKILPIILDIWPPILKGWTAAAARSIAKSAVRFPSRARCRRFVFKVYTLRMQCALDCSMVFGPC